MRKFLVLFLMVLLPLQWTAAVAADCCLRHDAAGQAHHAQLAHAEHGQADAAHAHQHPAPEKQAAGGSDCDQACLGCFAHHCAGVIVGTDVLAAVAGDSPADTPYLSRVSDPVPDNLYRPPLAALA